MPTLEVRKLRLKEVIDAAKHRQGWCLGAWVDPLLTPGSLLLHHPPKMPTGKVPLVPLGSAPTNSLGGPYGVPFTPHLFPEGKRGQHLVSFF